MSESEAELRRAKAQQCAQLWADLKRTGKILFVTVAVIWGLICFVGPVGSHMSQESWRLQSCHTIGQALAQFATDHDGHYPIGNSSTEVFRQLLNGRYVADAKVFYTPLPGKVRGTGAELKPENVCFDMTSPVDASSPDGLPLVFLTGFKITYAPGASAVPLPSEPRSWNEWWNNVKVSKDYLAVCFKSGGSMIKLVNTKGAVSDFIPPDFDPKGKAYRQLTP